MVSQKDESRAKELASKAQGNIKAKRLLSSGSGITGGVLPGNYLHDKPILSYFRPNEQPQYFFYNESKGVRIGETRKKSGWGGTYRNAMWVTDKGLHFTVGKSGGDFHYFMPSDSINKVNIKNGVTKNKFVFDTDEGQTRFPTDPSIDTDSATEYIRRRLSTSTTSSTGTSVSASRDNKNTNPTPTESDITLASLQRMDEYDFEQLVARAWERQGWTTEVTSGSTDRGIDVIATKSTPFEQRQYIQAKRYKNNNKVGSGEIQRYSGLYARNESVDSVVVVTTSNFTKEAQTVAANRNVKLVNGERLQDIIKKYNISI